MTRINKWELVQLFRETGIPIPDNVEEADVDRYLNALQEQGLIIIHSDGIELLGLDEHLDEHDEQE